MTTLTDFLPSAIRAHQGTSFDPEKRGEQLIQSFEASLSQDLEQIKDASEQTRAAYVMGYKKHLSAYLDARSRIVSPMISGGSNFPARRMQKYGQWEDNAYQRLQTYREKALKGIKKRIEQDKPQAQKIDEAWQKIERNLLGSISTIIDIDEGRERGYSRALFVSSITGLIKRMAANGQTEHVRRSIELIQRINTTTKKPVITEKNSIFSLLETAQQVQEDKEQVRENKEFSFEGGTIILNYDMDRVQIKHDSKPPYEVIQQLKKAAFKWSPSQGCWQRQLTTNALYSVHQLTGVKIY